MLLPSEWSAIRKLKRLPESRLTTRNRGMLRHLDAPTRGSRRVAQGDPSRRGGAHCQGARPDCDQRVHPNRATFVTLTISMSSFKFVLWAAKPGHIGSGTTGRRETKRRCKGEEAARDFYWRMDAQDFVLAVEYSLSQLGRTSIAPLRGMCRWAEQHRKWPPEDAGTYVHLIALTSQRWQSDNAER